MVEMDSQHVFGRFVKDAVEDKYMIVIDKLDKCANEVQVGYDYNCNPLTVYDYNKDKNIPVSPDEPVYSVVFPKMNGLESLSTDIRLALIDAVSHKEYYFPESRLQSIDESVIESEQNAFIESIADELVKNEIYHLTYSDMIFTKDVKAKQIFERYDDVIVRKVRDYYVGINYL